MQGRGCQIRSELLQLTIAEACCGKLFGPIHFLRYGLLSLTPQSIHNFIHLADSAWVLPLSLGLWLLLLLQRQWRAVVVWPLMVLLAMSIIVAGKLAFDLFGLSLPQWQFYNISGHAMFAALLYPTLGGVVTSGMGPRWHAAGLVAGILLALSLAAGLVWRLDHTLSETIAGATVGFVASATTLALRPRVRPVWGLLALTLPVAGLLLWQQVYHPVHQTRRDVWAMAAQWVEVDHRYSRRISRDAEGRVVVRVRRVQLRST